MANNKTNRFYGNKNTQTGIDGYFCGVEFDPIATGERITSMRRKRHLSREKLIEALDGAGLLRVSVTTMGKWERGEVKKMEAEQLEALRIFFQCSHDELIVYRYRENDDERDPLIPFILTSICFGKCSFFLSTAG